MQIIKPYTQIYGDINGQEILKKIEMVGRTCYKSEDKIKEGSAERLVASLIKNGHEAMLEHESFFFEVANLNDYFKFLTHIDSLRSAGYTCMLRTTYFNRGIVSGNIRMWRDFLKVTIKTANNGITDSISRDAVSVVDEDFRFFFGDLGEQAYNVFTKYKFRRINKNMLDDMERIVHYPITVKFICDRAIANEIVRHRVSSFAQESTRYCAYSKDQFNGEISCICPFEIKEGTAEYEEFKQFCEAAEKQYMNMLNKGIKAQIARNTLPLALKTELCMTTTIEGWRHFFELRACDSTGPAHPQIKELAIPLLLELKNKYPNDFPMTPVANPAKA
jgi:thymidylate synthase (FAD)